MSPVCDAFSGLKSRFSMIRYDPETSQPFRTSARAAALAPRMNAGFAAVPSDSRPFGLVCA